MKLTWTKMLTNPNTHRLCFLEKPDGKAVGRIQQDIAGGSWEAYAYQPGGGSRVEFCTSAAKAKAEVKRIIAVHKF